jgi:DNA topoisomerase VI subunit B
MVTARTKRRKGQALLQREIFRTSRLLDFFSEKELTAQIGHAKSDWPLVVLKELMDNALDAAEDAEMAPQVSVKVDKSGITVADNGPGIAAATVKNILDYSIRVSSREAYCSPTRGAQGNALKTIVAMPLVLDRRKGRVTVASKGIRHEITVRVDAIRQEPVIDHQETKDRFVKSGTSVTLHWPHKASSILTSAKTRFLQIAADYTFLNPHLTLSVNWFNERTKTNPTDPKWKKWLPSHPTSSHWYTGERFERLISAYLSADADTGRTRTIREFVEKFDGLRGSAKQKAVLEELALHRAGLSALRNGDSLDHGQTRALLAAMKAQTRPVKPAALGVIGKEHLALSLKRLGCTVESFTYHKEVGVTDGVPEIAETAFALRSNEMEERRLITGVNWSPGIVNPFRQLGRTGHSLDSVLTQARAGWDEPVVLVLHLACPRVNYTDRGKSAVAIGDEQDEFQEENDVMEDDVMDQDDAFVRAADEYLETEESQ